MKREELQMKREELQMKREELRKKKEELQMKTEERKVDEIRKTNLVHCEAGVFQEHFVHVLIVTSFRLGDAMYVLKDGFAHCS